MEQYYSKTRRKHLLSTLLFSTLLCCLIFIIVVIPLRASQELPRIEPEFVGVSGERLKRISELSRKWVQEKRAPGIVTAIARRGKLIHLEAMGVKGINDKRPLEVSDIFRIYSMTKPVTAVAVMQLYEQGKFHLSDPIDKYIPELSNLKLQDGERLRPAKNSITIHQLLTHTSGLSYGFDPSDPVDKAYAEAKLWSAKNLDDFIDRLSKLPLKFEPGTKWHYSVANDVLGVLVQRISGQRYDHYLKEHIFDPLSMTDTSFVIEESKASRFVKNHSYDQETGELVPFKQNGDECAALCNYQKVSLFSGGAGLVSTISDYLHFAEMLRNGGALNGVRILGVKTVKYMAKVHVPSIEGNGSYGLGFGIISDPVQGGVMGSSGVLHWSGAGGTVFWIDPLEELVGIGFVQVSSPRPMLRDDLRVSTYQALIESNELE